MKKNLLLIAAAGIMLIGMSFDFLSDNGKAGYTGSPAHPSKCNSCHGNTNAAVTSYLTSNMTNWQYSPGGVYTINLTVKQTGRSLFGYGLEVLNGSASTGTLATIAGNTKSSIKTANSIPNMVHTLNGGAHADSAVFSFKWTAPASATPASVKFWWCGVSADGSGSDNSADYINASSQVATLASTTGIEENNMNTAALEVVTNAADRSLKLTFTADESAETGISLFDLNGHEISRMNAGRIPSGENTLNMDLPGAVRNGIYVVVVRSGNQMMSRKVGILL